MESRDSISFEEEILLFSVDLLPELLSHPAKEDFTLPLEKLNLLKCRLELEVLDFQPHVEGQVLQ